jgi:hypothetical protein
MSDEFRNVAGMLHDAGDYRAVFPEPYKRAVKTRYRRLMRLIHPDTVDLVFQDEANSAVVRLNQLHAEAERALERGVFGASVPSLVLSSKSFRHECAQKLGEKCDVTNGYRAVSTDPKGAVDSLVKIAQLLRDNDLLKSEASALELLGKTDDAHRRFYPELLDSIVVADGRKRLSANVIGWFDGFVDLEVVRKRYPLGIHALDMAWIWRRVLWALGGAHDAGMLHGALVPRHLLIYPTLHGVILVDWCYSVKCTPDGYGKLSAVVSEYRNWYPEAVLDGSQTPNESLDLAFAARSMLYVTDRTTMPEPMQRYFDACMTGSADESAYDMLARFDSLLERLGAPYYPRTYRPLKW